MGKTIIQVKEVRGDVIGGDKNTTLVYKYGEIRTEPSTHVLFISARNHTQALIAVDEEQRSLVDAIAPHAELHTVMAARWDDVRRWVTSEQQWEIVHFAGHGGADGVVVMSDEGKPQTLPPSLLAGYLQIAQPRLVILNVCRGQTLAQFITRSCPNLNIIYSEQDLADDAALQFARVFYETYFSHDDRDIARAFTVAHLEVTEAGYRWAKGQSIV